MSSVSVAHCGCVRESSHNGVWRCRFCWFLRSYYPVCESILTKWWLEVPVFSVSVSVAVLPTV